MQRDTTKEAAISMMAETLLVGESANRQECPWCASRDYSFSVTRTETGVLYNCYRDTCRQSHHSSGFIGTSGVHTWGNTRSRAKSGSPFLGDLGPLDSTNYSSLYDNYRISYSTLEREGVKWNRPMNRYLIPVKNPNGLGRGWVARTPPMDDRKPKSLSYADNPDRPWIGWYGDPIVLPTVVIVEDHWSAMRLSQDCHLQVRPVALMGTHLSLDGAMEIAKERPAVVIWALDKDATASAFRQSGGHALGFGCKSLVIPIHKDLKDMHDEELEEFSSRIP